MQRKQPLSLSEYVPEGYRRLVTFTTVPQLREAAQQLWLLETPHAPNQYADWYCKVLQAVHPTAKEWPPQEEVKEAAAQPLATFEAGLYETGKVYQPYVNTLVDALEIDNDVRRAAQQNRITLLHYMPLVSADEARALGREPENLRRGHWHDGPMIHPDWIEQHDTVNLVSGIREGMEWYQEKFAYARTTGRLI